MPPFYIGSSSVKKVHDGYHGSVSSKEYYSIWWQEIKDNPHLFESKIICTFVTRQEAIDKEYKLQKQLNVVKNPLYINQAYSNGKFGLDMFGELNPFYGKKHTLKTKKKMSKPKRSTTKMKGPKSEQHKKSLSEAKKGKSLSLKLRQKLSIINSGEGNPFYGKFHTEESKLKNSLSHKGKIRITNGIISKSIHPSEPIPDGWRRGMK